MPSTVEQISPTRVKLTIEMPFADLKPSLDKAYKEIANQVNLPGFRKGKVPASLIDQRFGRGMVLQEAINDALPGAYAQAVEDNKLTPLGQPEIEVTKLEDGDVVEFTAEVDVRPDFDLPDASLVKVEVDPATVSDEDVDSRVQLLRQRFATSHEVERPAADGDIVIFDLHATQDGEPVAEGDAENMSYRVGAGGMIDGLDDAVRGMQPGESKTFTSTLVGGPHRGEQADIEVTVTKVQEQELPELDDDFAQLVSEFDTTDEMLADLRNGLERMARIQQANDARDKVLEGYLDLVDFEVPEQLVTDQQTAFRENITNQLAQAGLTLDDYLEDQDDKQTPEEFWAEVDTNARNALRAQIVLDKLADERSLQVSQADLTQLIWAKAQENGTTPDQETQHMMEHNHLPEWMGEIRRGKALGLLTGQAQVSDTEGQPIDLARLQADGNYADANAAQDPGDLDEVEIDEVEQPAAAEAQQASDEGADS